MMSLSDHTGKQSLRDTNQQFFFLQEFRTTFIETVFFCPRLQIPTQLLHVQQQQQERFSQVTTKRTQQM
jgi:hypothetical protein